MQDADTVIGLIRIENAWNIEAHSKPWAIMLTYALQIRFSWFNSIPCMNQSENHAEMIKLLHHYLR